MAAVASSQLSAMTTARSPTWICGISDDKVDGDAPGSHFERLFNPFLLLESTPPVPCDVEHGARAISIVTGPNSGGKTRLLQAVGLSQVLAQAGLFVPARSARLMIRSGMFVSLVQQAESDQSEGRLGTELLRIRRLFESLPRGGPRAAGRDARR